MQSETLPLGKNQQVVKIVLTKGRTAPALVTPAAGQSILKPRCLLCQQPHAAVAFAALQSNAFQ